MDHIRELNAAFAESNRLLAQATGTIHQYEANHIAGRALREKLRITPRIRCLNFLFCGLTPARLGTDTNSRRSSKAVRLWR
jgi:hypothetical protein